MILFLPAEWVCQMVPENIYQNILLDHYRHPRHFQKIPDDQVNAEMFNPLCGDYIRLHLETKKEAIESICFYGEGCAICIAYTSLMVDYINGIPIANALKQTDRMISILENKNNDDDFKSLPLDPLCVAKQFPMRSKCASLGWLTLKKALKTL